jgi:hypothetical protein
VARHVALSPWTGRGLLEQRFTNVLMGLSAHLEGVMNGIELASDLDSSGFRHGNKFSNHFSRAQRSAMASELCGSRISYRDYRNYRCVDARSLGS